MTDNPWVEFEKGTDDRETTLTGVEVARAAYKAGFPVEELVTAVAVSRRESAWKPGIVGTVNPASPDYGLWQISGLWHPNLLNRYQWDDPVENAKMAKILYDQARKRHGDDMGWQPWHTWTSGNYKVYLNEAAQAVDQFLKEQVAEKKAKESKKEKVNMFTAKFVKDTVERAVKTFAQAALAYLVTSGVTGLLEVDLVTTLSVAGFATLASVLTSVVSAGVGDHESASLVVATEELPPAR